MIRGARIVRRSAGLALAAATIVACGAPEASRVDVQRAEREPRAAKITLAACLVPAKRRACDPTFRVAFEGRPRSIRIADPDATPGESGELWCEDGRPHGRFERLDDGTRVDGAFGEAVWEAIDRVLTATGSCVTVFGRAAVVTRDGAIQACRHPAFDLTGLVVSAYWWARHKEPVLMKRRPPCNIGLCQLCPDECKVRVRDPDQRGPTCPRYEGDDLASVPEAPAKDAPE